MLRSPRFALPATVMDARHARCARWRLFPPTSISVLVVGGMVGRAPRVRHSHGNALGASPLLQDEAVGDANLRMRRSSSSRASSSPAIAAAPAASAAPLNAGRRDSVAGRGAQDNRPTRGSSGSMAAPAAAPVSAGAQKPAIARSGSISSLNGLGAGAVQPSPPPRTLTPPGAAATERPRKLSLLVRPPTALLS